MRIGDWSSDVCSSDLACLLDRNGGNCLCGIWTADANPEARARAKSIMGACRLPKPVLIARLTRWHPPVASRQSGRSEEHTSELQSLMRISYAVFCLKKTTTDNTSNHK